MSFSLPPSLPHFPPSLPLLSLSPLSPVHLNQCPQNQTTMKTRTSMRSYLREGRRRMMLSMALAPLLPSHPSIFLHNDSLLPLNLLPLHLLEVS